MASYPPDVRLPAFLIIIATLSGCEDMPRGVEQCGVIPDGGCPKGRGGSCEDPTCQAIYRCENDVWQWVEDCPSKAASDGGIESDASDAEPLSCGDAQLSIESGTGCRPSLIVPECPIDAIKGCPALACTMGCDDFYQCTTDGWEHAAYCDPEEGLVWTGIH